MRQDRQAIGADFISGVAVTGDAVRAGKNHFNLSLPHNRRGHVIADQCGGYFLPGQFPRRQPRALQKRPGFAGENFKFFTELLGAIHNPECGPVINCGQSAGVTNRHQSITVVNQFGAKITHLPANGLIVFVNRPSFALKHSFDLRHARRRVLRHEMSHLI